MDRRLLIWNLLHDGEITALAEPSEATHDVRVFVSIPYLRRRIPPLGDSFVLMLTGVARMEFEAFDGTASTLAEAIDAGSPEILSTESQSMPATIQTTMGRLILDFEGISFALDTGERIEYETIEKACEDYWTEWETKAKSKQTRAAPLDEKPS